MLEPRRIAAKAVAHRIASNLGEKVGHTVGYHIHGEKLTSQNTRILVVTEGILSRYFLNDFTLQKFTHIIFDEFHERSIHGDTGLGLCLFTRKHFRDDLKILIMSAFFETKSLSERIEDTLVITYEKQSFPVEIQYLPDDSRPPTRYNISDFIFENDFVSKLNSTGDILIFLPGQSQIRRLHSLFSMEKRISDNFEILSLHGRLDITSQWKIFEKHTRRRIILATNIAETSLTIPGIALVIDSGFEKLQNWHPNTNLTSLDTVFISHSSAIQRSGRAGREGPGICLRLWHKHHHLTENRIPEIRRTEVSNLALTIAGAGISSIKELFLPDYPDEFSVDWGYSFLKQIGAVSDDLTITVKGRKILETGAHPRIASILLDGSDRGFKTEAALLASALHEDIFRKNPRQNLLEVISETIANKESSDFLQSASNFYKTIYKSSFSLTEFDHKKIAVLCANAFTDRIGMLRKGQKNSWHLSSGKGAAFRKEKHNPPEFLIAVDAEISGPDAVINLFCPISRESVFNDLAHIISDEVLPIWDPSAKRVKSVARKKIGDLVILEVPTAVCPGSESVLLAEIQKKPDLLPEFDKKTENLRAKLSLLSSFVDLFPDPLPDISDASLMSKLEDWLLPFLSNCYSAQDLKKIDYFTAVSSLLPYSFKKRIDDLLPDFVELPSGRTTPIEYTGPNAPVIRARIQEFFGLKTNPLLAQGRIILKIELLTPANRPIQITSDIASFWENTYDFVRKELRGRYVKHWWPENPLDFEATTNTKSHDDRLRKSLERKK